jgi:hypothetical protein
LIACGGIFTVFYYSVFYFPFENLDLSPPIITDFLGELLSVFIADKFGINKFAVYMIDAAAIITVFGAGFICALKAAVGGLKQPNEFRKKRPASVLLIILNFVIIALLFARYIPFGVPFKITIAYELWTTVLSRATIKIGLFDIGFFTLLILPIPVFVADLVKNKRDLLEKPIK